MKADKLKAKAESLIVDIAQLSRLELRKASLESAYAKLNCIGKNQEKISINFNDVNVSLTFMSQEHGYAQIARQHTGKVLDALRGLIYKQIQDVDAQMQARVARMKEFKLIE